MTISARQAAKPTTPPAPVDANPVVPIKAWAVFGGVCVVFIVFIWGKWLLGPYTQTVPSGPSDPPTWMKSVLIGGQIVVFSAALGAVYWLLIRPWRRERRLTTDGILCVAFFFCVFQDPLTNWFSPWITYNSYLVNFGSWTHDIPGWLSFAKPGAQAPEPVLWPFLYICVWAAFTPMGCYAMRRAKQRWPRLGPYRLIGVAFVVVAVLDFVLEGLVFMPLGFWTYAGAPLPIIFPNSYNAFPLHEMIFIGAMGAGFCALRYYKNDRGLTLVERGAEKLVSPRRQNAYRLLAVIGATQLIFLLGFTIPVALIGAHARPWPADVQKRSYFTDHLCGAGTDVACPGPSVPLPRREHSARLGPDGKLVVPDGTTLPTLIPFDHH